MSMASLVFERNFTLPDVLNPVKGTTLVEEIRCYGLPYGGLGFISHLLTYYTIVMLSAGRAPFRPWRKLEHSKLSLAFSIIGLLLGLPLAVFTLVRCRNHWELLLIGIWKLGMMLFNSAVGIHTSFLVKKHRAANGDDAVPLVGKTASEAESELKSATQPTQQDDSTRAVWIWVLLYIPCMITGFVGLLSLIRKNWDVHPNVKTITEAFSISFMSCFCVTILLVWAGAKVIEMGFTIVFFIVLFSGMTAIFGDWALGAMTDNIWGLPSGDVFILYWSYFLVKRLTMFSS